MNLPTLSPEQACGTPINPILGWEQAEVMNPPKNHLQEPQEFSVVIAWSGVSLECFPFLV